MSNNRDRMLTRLTNFSDEAESIKQGLRAYEEWLQECLAQIRMQGEEQSLPNEVVQREIARLLGEGENVHAALETFPSIQEAIQNVIERVAGGR